MLIISETLAKFNPFFASYKLKTGRRDEDNDDQQNLDNEVSDLGAGEEANVNRDKGPISLDRPFQFVCSEWVLSGIYRF